MIMSRNGFEPRLVARRKWGVVRMLSKALAFPPCRYMARVLRMVLAATSAVVFTLYVVVVRVRCRLYGGPERSTSGANKRESGLE